MHTKLLCLRLSIFLGLSLLLSLRLSAQIVINEYSAANLDRDYDQYGKTEDWIELYNTSTETVNLKGWYLSDTEDEPRLWKVPNDMNIGPGEYEIFWCSDRNTGNHTNFKLTQTKNTAEVLVLSNPSGVVMDKREMKKNQLHHSRGRTTDGASTWSIFLDPTPGAANGNSTGYVGYAEKPAFNVEAGFYTDTQWITIINDEPNSVVRYTLNGNAPTFTSPTYTGPIEISSTKVLKAKVFPNDGTILPGFIEYSTYFINESHTLPVVSVAANQLITLANGDRNQRPIGSIEYFGTDKLIKARSYGELNAHGQDSWVNKQRSIDWVSRDEMGYSRHLKEKLFSGSERDEYQRVIIRAAGDDNYPDGSNTEGGGAHLRDAYIQNLADRNNLSLDVRRGEKAIVYLNGQYWGVYDLRELVDDSDYTEFYYGQDKYEIQYILTWGQTWAEYGENQALLDFQKTQDYILNHDMTVQENFDSAAAMVDLQSIVDYVIVNSATVCSDWLNWNTGWWRGLNENGQHKKWGFILWDNDATFGYYRNYTGIADTTAEASPCQVDTLAWIDSIYYPPYVEIAQDTTLDPFTGDTLYPGDTIIFFPGGWYDFAPDVNDHMKMLLHLRENEGFNNFYMARYADLMNTMFNCDTMLNFLDSQYELIKPEMQRHINRFGGSMQEWESNVSKLRSYISRRCNVLGSSLADCLELEGPHEVTFNVDPPGEGSLRINTLDIHEFPHTAKYFGGMQTSVEAIVRDDTEYKFDSWENTETSDPGSEAVSVLDFYNDATVTAHFVLLTGVKDFDAEGYRFSIQPTLTDANATVNFELPVADNVQVEMVDLAGKPISTLLNAGMQAGQFRLEIDLVSAGLSAGAYLVQIRTEKGFVKTGKVILQ